MTNESVAEMDARHKARLAQIDTVDEVKELASNLKFAAIRFGVTQFESHRIEMRDCEEYLSDKLWEITTPPDSAPREEVELVLDNWGPDPTAKFVLAMRGGKVLAAKPLSGLFPTPATEGEAEPVGYANHYAAGKSGYWSRPYPNKELASVHQRADVLEIGVPLYRKPPAPVEEEWEPCTCDNSEGQWCNRCPTAELPMSVDVVFTDSSICPACYAVSPDTAKTGKCYQCGWELSKPYTEDSENEPMEKTPDTDQKPLDVGIDPKEVEATFHRVVGAETSTNLSVATFLKTMEGLEARASSKDDLLALYRKACYTLVNDMKMPICPQREFAEPTVRAEKVPIIGYANVRADGFGEVYPKYDLCSQNFGPAVVHAFVPVYEHTNHGSVPDGIIPPAPVEDYDPNKFLRLFIEASRAFENDNFTTAQFSERLADLKTYLLGCRPPAPVSPVAPVVAGSQKVIEELRDAAIDMMDSVLYPEASVRYEAAVSHLLPLPEPSKEAMEFAQNGFLWGNTRQFKLEVFAALLSPEAEGGR